jgi:3-phosphoshikimate 1-carboxyvinyltransferase
VSNRIIQPAKTASGSITLPGDKSISHRYAILAGLAEGTSRLENYSSAADCRSTLKCLSRLGAETKSQNGSVQIAGKGLRGLHKSWRNLDAGNSGTTMRLLSGVLAGQSFRSTITGDDSLRRRPMRRIIEPLSQMGARISARDGDYAPLEISGSPLRGIRYRLSTPSAQVKSAILLAGLLAEGETIVEEPVRTRDHTELALEEFGVPIERGPGSIRIAGPAKSLRPHNLQVPGDLSSGVFFLAMALILPDSTIALHDVGLNPTRSAILDVLAGMGAPIQLVSVRESAGELIGDVAIRHAAIQGGEISGAQVAQLIDELPMLAALGPYTEKGIEIRDAKELRVKESDRIRALAENLKRMGASVEELPDGIRVAGRSAGKLKGADIDPRGDHRIAMAFAVAALGAEGPTTIRDAECAAVSFPNFFDVMDSILER